MIARRKVNTLAQVNHRGLQAQWLARLAAFFELPTKSIGRICGSAKKRTDVIDMALVQSLLRKDGRRSYSREDAVTSKCCAGCSNGGAHLIALRGGLGCREAAEARKCLSAIPAKEERILLVMGSYLDKGFEDARLVTLLLAVPISWKGRVSQYVVRLHQLRESKSVVRV